MNDISYAPVRPGFSPLALANRSLPMQVAAVLLGTLVLALASRLSVPMVPVPMTMQTLAVTLIGAFYGWRLGVLTIVAWLLEGAAGLPVLSNGASGLAYMMGPTGGYLVAFPFAAALVGWLAERGWNGSSLPRAFAAMLLGNLVCLAFGAAWLATLIGVERALLAGVVPFILGAIVKSALGAAVLRAFSRPLPGADRA
ncbi:biotin transporter BioY [Bosea caraganae]|uniref:Biotin transporter n=1 Tax=Bosea caraganae TaxID=2763117 RepID=A0A370L0X5_9HYPH|nr:biotin transporter BioY [Bosea caraganae]RDJ20512.1 biotin transporter BioY [Bosea caraganae]RDJ30028.1 biotin transporter BioY [Bosea caraganae]